MWLEQDNAIAPITSLKIGNSYLSKTFPGKLYEQCSLPHSILSSKNSHIHAGTASNCTFSTKWGTGLDETTEQNPQWYWSSLMRGIFNILSPVKMFEHTKLWRMNYSGAGHFLEMSCLDQDPLWRMASPKQVACKVQFCANPACVWLFLLLRMEHGRELWLLLRILCI